MILIIPIVTIFQYLARALGKNFIFIFSSLISSFLNLVLLGLFVMYLKLGIIGLLISFVSAQFLNIIFLFFSLETLSYLSLSCINFPFLKKLLIYSAPLVLNLTFGWFMNGFSRVYINITLGAVQNGIFAFGTKFSGIMASFASVINMAAIEDAVIKSKSGFFITRFQEDVNRLITLLWFFLLLSIPVINICFLFISNKDYSLSLNIIPILLLTAVVQGFSTLVGNFFNIIKKNKYIFISSVYGSLSTVFISFLFPAKFGLFGIAIAQLLGSLIVFFSRYFIGKNLKHYQINWKMFYSFLFLFIILSSFCSLTKDIYVLLFIFFVIIGLCLFFYRSFFIDLISRIKERV